MAARSCLYALILIVAFQSTMIQAIILPTPPQCSPVPALPIERIQFIINLIIYRAEFFLRSSIGLGINDIAPGLVQGPVPIGATVATLDNDTRGIIEELGLMSVGQLRAISEFTLLRAPIPRPLLNISAGVFSNIANAAFNATLTPPFDAYGSTNNFLIAATFASSYLTQYFTGLIPSIIDDNQKRLVAGIAVSEAAVFGVLRSQLYSRVNSTVSPYTNITVGRFFNLSSELVNRLAGCGAKDEGLIVPLQLGAENRTIINVVPADAYSLASPRYEREILRLVFGNGNATRPGALFPAGFNGILYQKIVFLRLA